MAAVLVFCSLHFISFCFFILMESAALSCLLPLLLLDFFSSFLFSFPFLVGNHQSGDSMYMF